jgi:hypothetical protein
MSEILELEKDLPIKPRKAPNVNPGVMLIYSSPKAGKTSICAQLPNSLLIECEPGGADYVDANVVNVSGPKEFNSLLDKIKDSKNKYQYIIIDTVTKLDEWAEIVGTYNYMNKTQGQKWNREGGLATGTKILHTDPRFETVHELGQGFGYQHSRSVMADWYDRISTLAPNIILLAHIKDKLIETKKGEIVEAMDINLTGKVKTIYASRADAIGYFYREEGTGILSFDNEFKVLSGGRCQHLNSQIVISEKKDNKLVTYWDKIYIK